MISKMPIISASVTFNDLLKSLCHTADKEAVMKFSLELSSSTRSKHVYLTDSGISSFYLILESLKKLSDRKEVILPAYTAGSLVVAVIKAGLKPVLCDISFKDFSLDEKFLRETISSDTLAVIAVHMFGINMDGIALLRSQIPSGVFFIEDCAQSMGSRTQNRECGAFGDVSFFSFNRGKNFPLYGGGAIMTDNEKIAALIKGEMGSLKERNAPVKALGIIKILAFSMIGNPLIYGLFFPLIARFKETAPPRDFPVKTMDNLHSSLGLTLTKRYRDIFSKRHQNGTSLINGLKGINGIILPEIPENTDYVFNRLPVLFKDINLMIKAERRLWVAGIETSRMYLRPLHHMFSLGYKENDFPNAVYCAQRLLTLPTHPLVNEDNITRMVKTIRDVMP